MPDLSRVKGRAAVFIDDNPGESTSMMRSAMPAKSAR
jgi:hypothetical protein